MSNFRSGINSQYDPFSGVLDAFSIKTSYLGFGSTSLIQSSDINLYFDAVIKLEADYQKAAPQNIGVYSGGVLYTGQNLTLSYQSSGLTLTQPSQEFTIQVPSIVGANPLTNPDVFVLPQITQNIDPSALNGLYANSSPSSVTTWNTLLQQRLFNVTLSPISGSVVKATVTEYGTNSITIQPVVENGVVVGGTFGASVPVYVGSSSLLGTAKYVSPERYNSVYYGIVGSTVYGGSQRPFVSWLPYQVFNGFSVQKDSAIGYLGLSSYYSNAGKSGLAQMLEGTSISADQTIKFRYRGWAADQSFKDKPFGAHGPILRSTGGLFTGTTGYALIIGDRYGTVDSLGSAASETAPQQAYLAKLSSATYAAPTTLTLVDPVTGALPRTSLSTAGVTILTNPTTLNFSSGTSDHLYSLKAVGNVISLTVSSSGGAESTLLTYTDATPVTSGAPGWVSFPTQENGVDSVNRWSLLSDVSFQKAVSFTPVNVELRTLFALNSQTSDYSTVFTAPASGAGTTLSWSSSGNTYTWGKDYGLPWWMGDTFPVAYPDYLAVDLDWDPSGYNVIDFSALLRLGTPVDLTDDTKVISITMEMQGGNYFADNTTNNLTNFALGVSENQNATQLDVVPFNDTTKIAWYQIPSNPGLITFSNNIRRVDINVPVTSFPAIFRDTTSCVYVKGAIWTDGYDGVRISNIRIV